MTLKSVAFTLGATLVFVGLLGFSTENLLIMQVNLADNLLHLVIAAFAIYMGFFFARVPAKHVV